ncbi:permease [Streptantibioticus ferralitis]|uniref:Permease n=1 Tax=Streptantibioticus ferralitis TaxID=236510 RepID=A0ABT5YVM3_9ACTN|nr:permease [Streptantibioticus ferralitis]MDF2255625.1 permease [Streptantibioticus ferralitis]
MTDEMTIAPERARGGVPDPAPAPRRSRRRAAPRSRWQRIGSLEVLVAGMVVLLGGRVWLGRWLHAGWLETWSTVFVAICVQALPFLVLGTLLSAAIAVFVPASFLQRALPKRPALAVPVAGIAGAVLPGCECASVPVAGGLIARGVAPAAALTFLLSAPAINPVVLTATAVAFPGHPEMVLARFAASLATAAVMGWLWAGFGRPEWLRPPVRRDVAAGAARWPAFRAALQHDFLHAGGFLVIGGITAATLNVLVPRQVLGGLGSVPVVSVVVLSVLAVLLAVCSEADAFVAASLSAFPLTARLTFMVLGPMVDVKLVALQAGTFGRLFAWRFSGATFVVGIVVSSLVGWWLL